MCNKIFLNHVSTVLLTPGIPQNSHNKHIENRDHFPTVCWSSQGNLFLTYCEHCSEYFLKLF